MNRRIVFFAFTFLIGLKICFAQGFSMDSIGKKYVNKKKISKSTWLQKGFNLLGNYSEEDGFSYYLSKISKFNHQNVFLVQSIYDSENTHWLVILDSKGRLLDFLNTAYDNAEGFTGTESHFFEEEVVVETYDIYEKPEEKTEVYVISEDRFLLKNDLMFEYSESYGSVCCPKDPAWNQKVGLKEFISKFEKENVISLKETYMVIQGKEGEKTYYLSFKGWPKKMKDKFIKERRSNSLFLNWSTMKKITYNYLLKNNRKDFIRKMN